VSTDEDTAKAITLAATDADNDALTYAIDSPPTHGTLGAVSGNTVTYTPAADYNGPDSFTFKANDGIANSNTATVSVTVSAVNDVPSFTKGANQTVLEDAGAQSVTGWATAISAGPANEATQTVAFQLTNNNNGLFSAQPAVAADGTLTYTPKANANGSATVTVTLHDDGGTANGGVDTLATQEFTITVTAVNDAPTVTIASFTVAQGAANTNATYADPDAGDTHTVVFTYKDGTNTVLTTTSKTATGGAVTDTSVLPAGCYTNLTVTVTVTDNHNASGRATSSTSAPVAADVYKASFQAPIMDNERNLAKAGNVVPVKVALTSSCTGAAVTTTTLYVQVVKGIVGASEVAAGSEVITVSASAADTGNQMRVSGGGYIYNLSTKTGFTTGEDYTIRIRQGSATGPIILTAVLRTTK